MTKDDIPYVEWNSPDYFQRDFSKNCIKEYFFIIKDLTKE